ncbi:MAG: arylsulfatase A-like enzyme, partial [Pseudohongiellaceae bacterium]
GIQNEVHYAQAAQAPLLAELLQGQGYVTAAFTDGGHVSENEGFDRGFDHFDSRYEWFGKKLDRVDAWLDNADESDKTFLFVHTYGVHAPYLPGKKHDLFTSPKYLGVLNGRVETLQERLARDSVDAPAQLLVQLMEGFWRHKKSMNAEDIQHLVGLYDGAIHRVDGGIGRLLASLDEAGWLDDAWVVITSDHGEAFAEHGTFEHRQLHQAELSVPLLIRPPGGLKQGLVRSAPISQLDLPPTLLHMLGQSAPAHMQGTSLLPLDGLRRAQTRFATGGEDLLMDVAIENGQKLVTANTAPRLAYDLTNDPSEERTDLEQPWVTLLERRLEKMRGDAQLLRKSLGDPLNTGPLSEEELQMLQALGYLK